MTAWPIVIALTCTFAVGTSLLTAEVSRPAWVIGVDKRKHPYPYWTVIGLLSFVGAVSWLRVAGVF
jgi:hypothetical protein